MIRKKYSVMNVEQTTALLYVDINFDPNSSDVDVSKGMISFERKFGRSDNIAKIWVTPGPDTPAGLRGQRGRNLFMVQLKGGRPNSCVSIDASTVDRIEYTIIMQRSTIVDCIVRDQREFTLPYTLHIKFENGDKEYQKKGEVNLHLQPISCHPKLSIDNLEKTYNPQCICHPLLIQNSSAKKYAPTLEMRVNSIYIQRRNEDGTVKDYQKSVTLLYAEARQTVEYNPGDVNLETATPQLVQGNVIRCIHPCQREKNKPYGVEVPMELDLSRLQNPMNASERYQVVVEYEYWAANNSNEKFENNTEKLDFTVLRNKAEHDMKVRFMENGPDGYGVRKLVNDGEHRVINSNKPFDVTRNGVMDFRLSVANIATVQDPRFPNAGVWIRKFKHDQDMDGAIAYAGSNIPLMVDDLVNDSMVGVGVNPQGITMLKASQAIDINLHVPDLAELDINCFTRHGERVFELFVKQKLSFQYYIAKTGNETPADSDWNNYETEVMFKFEIPPAREWMVVDFGTSAVVALYGSIQDDGHGTIIEPPIADLVERKRKLLSNAYGKESGYAQISEKGLFIDSDIQKNASGTINKEFTDEKYKDSIYLFSPGKQLDYAELLPSLKSLMGHERIPSKKGNQSTQPRVDDLYETVYRELFDLYLKGIANGAGIEKIILTYPNTFASIHVQKLKELARECLPSLRVVETISESDAIVYRYLNFTRNRYGLGDNQDQHVLVYDMGGGTLDITYFSNILDENRVRNVEILGKYGISKAGNYLDYVLADIVVQILEKKLGVTNTPGGTPLKDLLIDWDNERKVDVPIDERKQLKLYVKNILKPMMSEYSDDKDKNLKDVMMPAGFMPDLETFPLIGVFTKREFKNFINEVSKGVVESCMSNFSDHNCPIDVVVFSGRMTGMKCIRRAVRAAVEQIQPNSGFRAIPIFHFDANTPPDTNQLKTSVVLGAFDRVGYLMGTTAYRVSQSRPFFCRYALVVNRIDGGKEICCILDASTQGRRQGDNIQYSAREDVDLTGAVMITLVQTYAGGLEILDDYEGDRDVTTPLFSEDVAGEKGIHSVVVQVEVVADGQYEQGTQSVGLWLDNREINRLPHENIESRAFRMSAWPVEFA